MVMTWFNENIEDFEISGEVYLKNDHCRCI
jgi:hypothetical protein